MSDHADRRPAKKAVAKKAPAKRAPAKRAPAKRAPAKRAARTRAAKPLQASVAEGRELADLYAAKAAAKAAKRGKALRREAFYVEMHGDIDAAALTLAVNRRLADEILGTDSDDPSPTTRRRRSRGAAAPLDAPAPRAFPVDNANRWVPIGPSVTRRGQAMSRPRTSGRIRDVAVSPDGQRAYAISAKGGVWYSGDAGATWSPVGGWAGRSVNALGNGNMFSGGSLLVDFSAGTVFTDVVMVGTGEPVPGLTETGAGAQGGIGVLVALGPTTDPIASDPWEVDTGAALLGGVGVRRLVRHPAATSFATAGATQDRVLAATTDGLYLGTRSPLPAVAAAPPVPPSTPPQPAVPARDGFTWAACAAAPKGAANDVTDAIWLANGATTRIVFAVGSGGVFFSDNNGGASTPIALLQAPGVAFGNRISLELVPGTSRVYVLAEVNIAGVPTATLWQITDVLVTPQTVVAVPGVPPDLFGDPTTPPTQAWYDHGLAVEVVGANDRIYLGGSTVIPRDDAEGQWSGSLFCFETPSPPAAVAALAPAVGVSRRLNPPAGDAADRDGLIGNNVHADIHAIRLTGGAAPNRHVWVGCDGGVYVSEHSGRVNTFASRNTGLATLEPIFLANHPTSSHFMFVGFQDNGSQVRIGDTVWEETFLGDGGGTVIHPIRSDIVMTQWTAGNWNGAPANAFVDPLTRRAGNAGNTGREGGVGAFYSGAAVIADSATTARVALGTNRVWVTDNLGDGTPVRWRTLPYPAGTQRDTRPGGGDPAAQQAFGVPAIVDPAFVDAAGNSTADQVIDMVWQSGTDLLVAFKGGLVRYTNTSKPAGTWTSTTWLLTAPAVALPLGAVITAVAAIPASLDFYVATLGNTTGATETLWFFDNATSTFLPTALRQALDFGPPVVPGPLDPCFAVVVDPVVPTDVYVGTATGVWRGQRAGATWTWSPFMNGLPQATVQDLDIWQDPAGVATSPRLLRAGMQSRGLWEVDLAHPEPRRTYVRVHERDDRRMLPTPMANPRRRPGAPLETGRDSPDIVVRPAWPIAAPPAFHSTITGANTPVYDLWTFQTAFRWLYPSCVADGRLTDAFRDLVRFHRSVLGLAPGTFIDQTLWRHVVGGDVGGVQRGVRLLPDPIFSNQATVTANVADALAVYRAPWQTTLNFSGAGTEIDFIESVLPVRSTADEWTVFREPSTVDVLLHHRDSRPVPAPQAFAVLLWRSAPTAAALLTTSMADLPPYLAAVIAAAPGAPVPGPAGWKVGTTTAGAAMNPLTTSLDARLPRAVSIDVDLSGVPNSHRVLLLAMVGSRLDDPVLPPVGAPANVADLVQAWPNAALRVIRVTNRV